MDYFFAFNAFSSILAKPHLILFPVGWIVLARIVVGEPRNKEYIEARIPLKGIEI
jgi:hypothetical protein